MKKLFVGVLVFFSMFMFALSTASAGELDILIEKLVEKDILSLVEAQIILDETKAEVAKQNAQGKNSSLPKWVQTMKLKGDLRLRVQKEKKTSDDDHDIEGRVRMRLGIEGRVTDTVKVGVGIATAGSSNDPRSRNVTLNDSFDTFPVEWDYGFVEWAPKTNLKMVGGKFKRKPYLWLPTDMLWDGDITPEGGSIHWEDGLFDIDNTDYWVNGGIWILDENGHADASDPYMKYVQGGLRYKEGMLDSKASLTLYDFQGIEDIVLSNSKVSQGSDNTTTGSSYTSLSPAFEIGLKEPFGGLPFNIDERIAVFAEYVHNLDNDIVTDELNGWTIGFKFGNKKIKKKGQWQFKYMKTKLQQDAWLDILPDSDRWSGQTDVEAHEISLKYGLAKNITFGLDYYKSWDMDAPNVKQNLFQADLIFKF